jgi:NAD-dependent DNA ligase
MVVHSYLYYVLDTPIVSDDQWQAWADELTKLQTENPDCCKIKYYDREFFDWTGDTGMHLPKTPHVQARAKQILRAYETFSA